MPILLCLFLTSFFFYSFYLFLSLLFSFLIISSFLYFSLSVSLLLFLSFVSCPFISPPPPILSLFLNVCFVYLYPSSFSFFHSSLHLPSSPLIHSTLMSSCSRLSCGATRTFFDVSNEAGCPLQSQDVLID